MTMRGFDIPREQLEAGWEAYEDQLARCARCDHAAISEELATYGSPDVPNGEVTYKVRTCRVCGEEWT
jgi:hypothetical protein